MKSIQLFHYFFFQAMTFCKLFGKNLLVVRHSGIKLIFGYIYIINLDVEILSGRKRISFFFYLIVSNSHGKIFYSFLSLECADNLLYLIIIQSYLFNPLASLFSSPNLLASIKIAFSAVADLSKNNTQTFVPVLANTLLGMETQPDTTLSSTIL